MPDKRKILIADDDPGITVMVSAFLNQLGHGYELHRAFNKDEALKLLSSFKFEVVLLDIDFYGVNSGLQILDIINREYKETKPIVLTGRAKHNRAQIEAAGCYYFFEKPVDLMLLNDKIKDALGLEKIIQEKAFGLLKGNPKAKLLFVAPNLKFYAYLCAIFNAKELLNGAEYIVKIVDNIGNLLDDLATFQPDIVLIGDYFLDNNQIINLAKLIQDNIKIRPKSVIVHGLFEREDIFEYELKKKGIKRCIQNVMDNDQMLRMNRKLSDFVAQECAEHNLLK